MEREVYSTNRGNHNWTLSYWIETWAEIKFHKAKLLKKRFVPRLVTEKLKREINLNEIKYALSLQQRTLQFTCILTNISGFARLLVVYFRAVLQKIQIFFPEFW